MVGRRGLYDDFGGRRVASDDELAVALQRATVVVDSYKWTEYDENNNSVVLTLEVGY